MERKNKIRLSPFYDKVACQVYKKLPQKKEKSSVLFIFLVFFTIRTSFIKI